MKIVCHVSKQDDTFVLQCPSPEDAGVAFVLIGRLLLATPGGFTPRHREMLSELLNSLVPADVGPPIMMRQGGPS